jgi:hypothetical protein
LLKIEPFLSSFLCLYAAVRGICFLPCVYVVIKLKVHILDALMQAVYTHVKSLLDLFDQAKELKGSSCL